MNVMSEGGDIHCGDFVYYRGEVWTVHWKRDTAHGYGLLNLERLASDGVLHGATVYSDKVQRVESIR